MQQLVPHTPHFFVKTGGFPILPPRAMRQRTIEHKARLGHVFRAAVRAGFWPIVDQPAQTPCNLPMS